LTFGARYNWLVLIAFSAAGVLIRAYFVDRHKRDTRGGKTAPWPALLALGVLAATAAALAPSHEPATATAARSSAAQFAEVQRIVITRCVPCHASTPTHPGFMAAPKGLMLDTPAAILLQAPLIAPQVAARTMPIGNLTGMTDAERGQLLDWIRHGAPH
ncbi:MAG TPA: hypothetical protein VNW26_11565, partial [Steroidobacteraceae bacterium]|nr:hypothetical protein [Steroidobacteraceae bacterium]